MNIDQLKVCITSDTLEYTFRNLYSENIDTVKERYLKCVEGYESYFGAGNDVAMFSSPGRTEVGGNHTDHQHGRVLAGAVDLDIIATVQKMEGNLIRIYSEGFGFTEVDLSQLEVIESEKETSAALVRGIAAKLIEKGYKVGGFHAYVMSNVLNGSGLSSSAAFEVLICTIFNQLYCNKNLTPIEIAQISQYAENIYFGKPSGLMDQTTCAVGGFVAIDFATSQPKVKPISFNLQEQGYQLVIVNTGANHADLTDAYASIPQEMKSVAQLFGKEYLNEVDESDFYQNLDKVRMSVSDRAILRAIHFFNDTNRVLRQADALERNDIATFLKEVNASGQSSNDYLQNSYSINHPSEQSITLALCMTKQFLQGEGACRVHGGGFAGTIQAYIPITRVQAYIRQMEKLFGSGCCYCINIRSCGGIQVI